MATLEGSETVNRNSPLCITQWKTNENVWKENITIAEHRDRQKIVILQSTSKKKH